MADKIDELYDALHADGLVQKDRNNFRQYMLARGEEGYRNRKKLYDALHADGIVSSGSYEEFAGRLGLHGVPSASAGSNVQQTRTANAQRTGNHAGALGGKGWLVNQAREAKKRRIAKNPLLNPTLPENKPKEYLTGSPSEILADAEMDVQKAVYDNTPHDNTAGYYGPYKQGQSPEEIEEANMSEQQRIDAGMDEANQSMEDFGQNMERMKEQSEYDAQYAQESLKHLGGRDASLMNEPMLPAGVYKGGIEYNPETGKYEQAYYTEDGKVFDLREAAIKQRAINLGRDEDYQKKLLHEQNAEDIAEIDQAIENRHQELRSQYGEMDDIRLSMMDSNPMSMYGMSPQEVRANGDVDMMMLRAAKKAHEDANAMMVEAGHNKHGKAWGEQSFAAGALRGFGKAAFNPETWDFGLSDMRTAAALYVALDKADKNKPLTKAEQMLLDAKAKEMVVNAFFSSDIGRGYKAGQVTGEALPFMLEMAINPASGIGKGATKQMIRYAFKKFGGKGLKYTATKWGTRLATDLVGAAAMTATTGAMQTAANTMERMNGDVQYDKNADGEYKYAGHTKGDDFGTAFTKAFASNTFERYSEFMGEYFAPILAPILKPLTKGAGATAKWLKLDKLSEALTGSSTGEWARGVNSFLKKTQWHGPVAEYFEEVANNMLSTMTGDKNWGTGKDGVFNLDDNIDTFLGVALMGGVFSTIRTVGYKGASADALARTERADRYALSEFGDQEKWGAYRNTIAMGSDEDVKALLSNVMQDKNLTDSQKRAVANYAALMQQYKGAKFGESKHAAENPEDAQNAINEAYQNGWSLATSAEMHNAQLLLNQREKDLEYLVGAERMEEFRSDPIQAMANVFNEVELPENERQVVLDYVNAYTTVQAMNDKTANDVANMQAHSDAEIASRTNKNGTIQGATLKVDGRNVYIMDGDVVMTQDGTGIDQEKSTQNLIVKDAASGRLEYVAVSDLQNVDAPINAAEESKAAREAIAQQLTAQREQQAAGVQEYNVGDEVEIPASNGRIITGRVTMDNGDGTVMVTTNNGIDQAPVSKEVLNKFADRIAQQRIAQEEQARKQQQLEEAMAEAQPEVAPEPVVETPEPVVPAEPFAPGAVHQVNFNGNPATIEIVQDRENGVVDVKLNGRDMAMPKAMIENLLGIESEPRTQAPAQPAAPMQPEPAAPAVEPMPMDKKGNPLFNEATPERGAAWLARESELEPADVATYIDNMAKNAQKALEALQKKPPKMGTDIAKFQKEKKEYQGKLKEAQKAVDFWGKMPELYAQERKNYEDEIAAAINHANEMAAQEQARVQSAINQTQADQTQPEEAPKGEEKAPAQFVLNEFSDVIDEEGQALLDEIAHQTGRNIRFADPATIAADKGKTIEEAKGLPGYFDTKTGEIVLNTYFVGGAIQRTDAVMWTLGHELTHVIRNAKTPDGKGLWDAYVKAVIGAMGEKAFEDAYNETEANYDGVYDYSKMSPERKRDLLIEEVVADWAGRNMARSGQAMQTILDHARVAGADTRSIIEKVLDYIRKVLDTLGEIAKTVGLNESQVMQKQYAEAAHKIWEGIYQAHVASEKEAQVAVSGGLDTGENMVGEKYSVSALGEGVGFEAIERDANGNVAFRTADGRVFTGNNPVTVEDLKEPNSVMSYMIADALALGTIREDQVDGLLQKYADMLNAALEKGLAENGGIENLASNWQWVADTIFKTVAENGDAQYSYSLDITRVCKKNEAVINAISELQRQLGYGISPGQVMDIYLSTKEAGFQVPCPVCYVFSRYIRNGRYATIAIRGQKMYGDKLKDPKKMSPEEKREAIAYWVSELQKQEEYNETHKKAIEQAKSDITLILDKIDNIGRKLLMGVYQGEQEVAARREIDRLDRKYKAALNVVAQSGLASWIKQFAIHKVKGNWTLWPDTYQGFPEEYALDLRLTGDVMRMYPGIQRLRKSGGSAAGKEITFAANNDLGEVAMMLGSKNQENFYKKAVRARTPETRKKWLAKARKRFADAHRYAQQQSLRGGQRMWSWSDNIERLSPDVFVNLMQLQLLGGALQSYSKQLEGIKLVASMNGYVNGSLMGYGDGVFEVSADQVEERDGKLYLKEAITGLDTERAKDGRNPNVVYSEAGSPVYEQDGKMYVLAFDDIVGIQAYGEEVNGKHMKGLFELNKELDRAGNILVGMNDIHIFTAMADPRVFFIIPWHASGMSDHILRQMMTYLGVDASQESFKPKDYTDVQEEKDAKGNVTPELVALWERFKNEYEYACGIEGGIESGNGEELSESQMHYRGLRDRIFKGVSIPKLNKKGEQMVDKKTGKPLYKVVSVLEAERLGVPTFIEGVNAVGENEMQPYGLAKALEEIRGDEFLAQTLRKVGGTVTEEVMTNGDTKYMYPYEYWDEASTYDTADVNGKRYIEYCRRLGRKPKFCGKLNGKTEGDFGNFVDAPGYWKLLIDRRMYDTKGNFQDLTPVESDGFNTALVDPERTKEEFIVTKVANDNETKNVVARTRKREAERPGGESFVDYDLTLDEAVDAYNEVEGAPRDKFAVQEREELSEDDYGISRLREIDRMYEEGEDEDGHMFLGDDYVNMVKDVYEYTDDYELREKLETIIDRYEQDQDDWYEYAGRGVGDGTDNFIESVREIIREADNNPDPTPGGTRYARQEREELEPEQEAADEMAYDGGMTKYAVVTKENATDYDKQVMDEIAEGKVKTVYRSMQVIEMDGQKYAFPPMSAKVDGEWVQGVKINDDGTLEPMLLKADERLDLMREDGKYNLDKGNGKSVPAAYNPYWHTKDNMLNDQFSEAQDRPNLITVEGMIPESELTSGYRAEHAKDSVGAIPWKAGIIQGQLTGTSTLYLSRYFQGLRVVPASEVAENIYNSINGVVSVMPTNVTPPDIRAELEKLGVEFVETDNQGKLKEGEHKGDYYTWWYGKNAEKNRAKSFSDKAKKEHMLLSDWLKANGREGQVSEKIVATKDKSLAKAYAKEDGTRYAKQQREPLVTPEQDAEYLEAVNSGNMERAAEMVRDAAAKAMPYTKVVDADGKPIVMFHGSDKFFNEFKMNDGALGKGAYFTSTFAEACDYVREKLDNWELTEDEIDEAGYVKEFYLDVQDEKDIVPSKYGSGEIVVKADKPSQIKSADPITYDDNGNVIPLSERFNSEKDDIRWAVQQREPAPMFISNAQRAVEGIKQNKATGDQWLAMLQKAGGLKAEEDKWMGLSDFLKGKKSVTKDELLQFIAENDVQIEEVMYGDGQTTVYKDTGFIPTQEDDGMFYLEWPVDYMDVVRGYNKAHPDAPINIDNWSDVTEDDEQKLVQWQEELESLYYGNELPVPNATRTEYRTQGLTNNREIALVVPTVDSYYGSMPEVHFVDEYTKGKAIAWIRFGDATDSEGNKVLVLDEVQSQRHQDGRENGYDTELREAEKAYEDYAKRMRQKYINEEGVADGEVLWTEYATEEENMEFGRLWGRIAKWKLGQDIPPVPDAPWQKTWHELAMKRMLRYAAENGYNKIAWTTGLQQAERYGLGGKVEKIGGSHDGENKYVSIRFVNGEFTDFTVNPNGEVIEGEGEFLGQRLSDIIGKEIADSIINLPENENYIDFSGSDLVVGGKGMQGFYDQMLPKFMDKYGKKWGVKTKDVELDLPNKEDRVMHSVDVTEAMKESVMNEGQTKFAKQEREESPSEEDKAKQMREHSNRMWYKVEELQTRYGGCKKVLKTPFNREILSTDDDFRSRYNYDQASIDKRLDEIESGEPKFISGFAMPEQEKIVIFTDRAIDEQDVEDTFFHENFHVWAQVYYGNGKRKLCENFWNALDGIPEGQEIKADILDYLIDAKYEVRAYPEEAMAALVAGCCSRDARFGYIAIFLSDEDKKDLKNFLKYVNYDTKKEREARRERSQSNGTVSSQQQSTTRVAQEAGTDSEEIRGTEQGTRGLNDSTTSEEQDTRFAVQEREELPEETRKYMPNMGIEEAAVQGLINLARANEQAQDAKQEVILQNRQDVAEAASGQLGRLRKAMAAQRKYDKATVDGVISMARLFIDNHLLDNVGHNELVSLLTTINGSTGRENLEKAARRMIRLMLKHQARASKNLVLDALKIKSSKVSNKGVKVQGRLDPNGQEYMAQLKDAMKMPLAEIDKLIAQVRDDMGSDKESVRELAAIRYRALLVARKYVEEVKDAREEEEAIRRDMEQAQMDVRNGEMTQAACTEFLRNCEDLINENLMRRANAAYDVLNMITDTQRASINEANAWKEREQQRVANIQHMANSDTQGRPYDEHKKDDALSRLSNSAPVRFFAKPLANFVMMFRMLGSKSIDGAGYLYNHFVRRWVDATQAEWENWRDAEKELDAKVREVCGRRFKHWSDLYKITRKGGATMNFWDGGESKPHVLTQGNMMYVYMVAKMKDGMMKLNRMGITEADVAKMAEALDPRLKELADWVQNEFLPNRRDKYNEVYRRMFNANMDAIDNYFPLKILKNDMHNEEDVNAQANSDELSSEVTENIIKRKHNTLALDVLGTDAASVVIEHVQKMEHWRAFAELIRDINTLLSYKKFRNTVKNMRTSQYGSGENLWKNFKDCCAIAMGTYKSQLDNESLDRHLNNFGKMVTAAKVSCLLYTAMKQLTSFPAYFSAANWAFLALTSNPIGAVASWKWAMKNLPMFEKRWKSRAAGNYMLEDLDSNYAWQKKKLVRTLGRWGMTANAFVDAMTVSMGGYAIYLTKYNNYKLLGYDEETAKKRALQDAAISVNETQQSSEGAFMSPMQAARSYISSATSIFRNSPFGYQRQVTDAVRNLKHFFALKNTKDRYEFMVKQMVRDGIDESKAKKWVAGRIAYTPVREGLRITIFAWTLQFLWNLCPNLIYLLAGDDDDEKEAIINEAGEHAFWGSIEGLTMGNLISELGNARIQGTKGREADFSLLPLLSDIKKIYDEMEYDEVVAYNDMINLAIQIGIGVNPQSIESMCLGIWDACNGQPKTAREAVFLAARILNMPQQGQDKLWIDEVGLPLDEAKKLSVEEIAQRYAAYKVKRGATLTEWMYSVDEHEQVILKQVNRFEKMAKERWKKSGYKDMDEAYEKLAEDMKPLEQKLTRIEHYKRVQDFDEYDKRMNEFADTKDFESLKAYQNIKKTINNLDEMAMRAKTVKESREFKNESTQLKKYLFEYLQSINSGQQASPEAMQAIFGDEPVPAETPEPEVIYVENEPDPSLME